MNSLASPFPYFGGKSRIAAAIWERIGDVPNYVEPFFGSGAVLLGRPEHHCGGGAAASTIETVNDKCGYIANFWRAVRAEPDAVAEHADWPINENDLHARHAWLVARADDLVTRLEGDPEFHDAKIAGWWCWGMCCWIGSGFCSGKGPWRVVDGKLVHLGDAGRGVNRQLVHLGNAGQGVTRKLVHLGPGRGVTRQLVHLGDAGRGVNRKLVHLGNAGQGLREWMQALAVRLRFVRVCCGDWSRVVTETPTKVLGLTGVVLDPPYADTAGRASDLYRQDDETVAHAVREWAIAHGDDPQLRVALCGYEGEHAMPDNWECLAWKASGWYGSQGSDGSDNSHRERVWFSPHCLRPEREAMLFDTLTDPSDQMDRIDQSDRRARGG